jgi:hypothetical protein
MVLESSWRQQTEAQDEAKLCHTIPAKMRVASSKSRHDGDQSSGKLRHVREKSKQRTNHDQESFAQVRGSRAM